HRIGDLEAQQGPGAPGRGPARSRAPGYLPPIPRAQAGLPQVSHPRTAVGSGTAGGKLRSIPVWLPFNDPDLLLRASYTMFDRRTGRPLCVGNGETCRRVTPEGVQSMPCAAPEGCSVADAGGCKPYARLTVRIGEEDELGTFIFRTTGFNSIRTLAARLHYL